MTLTLAFMGTPDFAVPSLKALLAAGHRIAAVYTQPPRPAGRGQRLQPSPVQREAEAHGLPVHTPATLKTAEEQARFRALPLDAAVVVAYGLILPVPILEAPRLGCLNIHASLLPRWRGAAPIQRAILAGDHATGITIMAMAAGLDTGPMLHREAVQIGDDATGGTLHDQLAALGAALIGPVLDAWAAGAITPEAQPEAGVTYAAKLTREDGRIAWQDAAVIARQVRALSPAPGAWFALGQDRIKVLAAERRPDMAGEPGLVLDGQLTVGCATGGAIRPTLLQRPGRGVMTAPELLRGYPVAPGTRLPCASS